MAGIELFIASLIARKSSRIYKFFKWQDGELIGNQRIVELIADHASVTGGEHDGDRTDFAYPKIGRTRLIESAAFGHNQRASCSVVSNRQQRSQPALTKAINPRRRRVHGGYWIERVGKLGHEQLIDRFQVIEHQALSIGAGTQPVAFRHRKIESLHRWLSRKADNCVIARCLIGT